MQENAHLSQSSRGGGSFLSRKASFFIPTNDFSFEKKRVVENGKGKRQWREGEMERDKKKSKF
tara:strand:- start:167 stop:355 length:189 start_codon:yes stop_codon:yes gene_type:complete